MAIPSEITPRRPNSHPTILASNNHLAASKHLPIIARHNHDIMALRSEPIHSALGDALLQMHHQRAGVVVTSDANSRGINGTLGVKSAPEAVEKDLDVTLRLLIRIFSTVTRCRIRPTHHETAHYAKHCLEILSSRVREHSRDNGMVWSLVRCEDIRMALLQREARASVLENKTAAGGDDPGAEPPVGAVDERAGVALSIGHGEVDRVS